MKRITSNKKGFTLLEVMLAVAVLSVASSMVMVGFLTTMTYSKNSALYARVGSSNYSDAITLLSSMKATPSLKDSLNPASAGTHTVNVYGHTITPTATSIVWGTRGTTPGLYVRLNGDTRGQITATDAYNFTRGDGSSFHTYLAEVEQDGGASQPSYANNSTYSDNRTALFYYCPLTCPVCQTAGNVGNIQYGSTTAGGAGFYCRRDHRGMAGLGSYVPDASDGCIKIGHLDASGAVVAD